MIARHRHARPPLSSGFTLLEAIIALTVMATSMIALYAWLSSSAIALSRVQANARALEDQRTALALIETINPMAELQGERELPTLTVRWKSTPLTERLVGITKANRPSAFDLALYELEVEVLRNRQVTASFTVRRTGWINARPIQTEEF